MIYFAQPVAGGPIKIGTTTRLTARIKELEATYGQPLAVLGTCEGDKKTESEIHRRFRHLRFGVTEQFRPAPDLLDFIGRPLFAGGDSESVAAIPAAGRCTIFHVKGSAEYVAWFDELHRRTHIPKVVMARIALKQLAERLGVEPPPEI